MDIDVPLGVLNLHYRRWTEDHFIRCDANTERLKRSLSNFDMNQLTIPVVETFATVSG